MIVITIEQMVRVNNFEQKTPDPITVEYIYTPSGNIPIYSISSFHALTQFIGYGKHINRNWGNVYLRGQTSLYDGLMVPSLFRQEKKGEKDENGNLFFPVRYATASPTSATEIIEYAPINFTNRFSQFKHLIKSSAEKTIHFKNWDLDLIEPLLQHYGIKTQWLDVVDNIWIALWFAMHQTASTIIDGRQYIHIYERTPDQFGYIFLMGCSATIENTNIPGLYKSSDMVMVDLRKAIPSYFLRPHAQHALMIRKPNSDLDELADYTDKIIGIAKVSVATGLKWIGQTDLLSVQSLFPPPYYDNGYAELLNEYKPFEAQSVDIKNNIKKWGSIQEISC